MSFKVAIIQTYPIPACPSRNFATASQLIRISAASGAHLAVLPEYHLTSWIPQHPRFVEICRSSAQKYLPMYQQLAQLLQICIVPGTIVEVAKNEHGHEVLYNTAYFIDSAGEIIGYYRKKNLWVTERAHLTANPHPEPHQAFTAKINGCDIRIGVLICWDLAFASAFSPLISQDAQLVIIPTFWLKSDPSENFDNMPGLKRNPEKEGLYVNAMCLSRAFEFSCAVVMCNAGGPSKIETSEDGSFSDRASLSDGDPEPGHRDFFRPSDYLGLSQLCMPFVGRVVAADDVGQCITYGDVNLTILEEAEANYQTRRDVKDASALRGLNPRD